MNSFNNNLTLIDNTDYSLILKHKPELQEKFKLLEYIILNYEKSGFRNQSESYLYNWYNENLSYSFDDKSKLIYSGITKEQALEIQNNNNNVIFRTIEKFCYYIVRSHLLDIAGTQRCYIKQASFYDDLTSKVDAIAQFYSNGKYIGFDFTTAESPLTLLSKIKTKSINPKEFFLLKDISCSTKIPRYVIQFPRAAIGESLFRYLEIIESGGDCMCAGEIYKEVLKLGHIQKHPKAIILDNNFIHSTMLKTKEGVNSILTI